MLSENILTRYKASSSRAFGGRPPFHIMEIKRPLWQTSDGVNGSSCCDDGGGGGRLGVAVVAKSK